MADHDSLNGDPNNTATWRRIWLKAVARAWNNEAFKKQLIAHPIETLHKEFGYKVPSSIHIQVVETDPSSRDIGWSEKGWNLPQTTLVLPLPPKPAGVADGAVALSDLFSQSAGSCSDTCCF